MFLMNWFMLLNQNYIEVGKSVALLVSLIAHILMGTGILQRNITENFIQSGGTGTGMSPIELSMAYPMPLVTRRAPHFTGTAVINKELVAISLDKFTGKYVVLLFYALDFSSVCSLEVTAFSDRLQEFQNLNTVVIACSVDSPYAHITWVQLPRKGSGLGNIKIPLLSDISHKISQDYGVYMSGFGHSLRGQFIIDTAGIIRQATINDLHVARSVDETLRLIKACQAVDKTGHAF